MQNAIDAHAGASYGIGVNEIDGEQVDLLSDVREVLAPPSRKVVNAAHVVPALDERLREVRSDKARDAGKEIRSQENQFIVCAVCGSSFPALWWWRAAEVLCWSGCCSGIDGYDQFGTQPGFRAC